MQDIPVATAVEPTTTTIRVRREDLVKDLSFLNDHIFVSLPKERKF